MTVAVCVEVQVGDSTGEQDEEVSNAKVVG